MVQERADARVHVPDDRRLHRPRGRPLHRNRGTARDYGEAGNRSGTQQAYTGPVRGV